MSETPFIVVPGTLSAAVYGGTHVPLQVNTPNRSKTRRKTLLGRKPGEKPCTDAQEEAEQSLPAEMSRL
jgi:hypothetical protein